MIPLVIFIVVSCLTPTQQIFFDTNLPALVQELQPAVKKEFKVTQGQPFRYQFQPTSRIISSLCDKCHIHPAILQVEHLMMYDLNREASWKNYAFNRKEKSIYQIGQKKVTKYNVNWQNFTITKGQSIGFKSQCEKTAMENFEDDRLFVFSCEGVYSLGAKMLGQTSLVIGHEPKFQAFKVVRYQQLVLEVSATQGINVYLIDYQLNLKQLMTITKFKDQNLHIADVFYSEGKLYVLCHDNGLFVYLRKADNFIAVDSLALDVGLKIQYTHLTMKGNNIFIAFDNQGQSSVVEGLLQSGKFTLIRYFKGYNSIEKISIFENMLLIQSTERIDLMPVNVDPRMVHEINNGFSYSHQHQIQRMYFVQDSRFLLVTPQKLQVVHLSRTPKVLQCNFGSTNSHKVILETICDTFNGISAQRPFYHSCTQIQELDIYVTEAIKDNYVWLMLIALGVFIVGAVSLIYWRQEQQEKIQKVFRKIKYFKFKFQNAKTKPIEFEEVEHAYSDMMNHMDQRNNSFHSRQQEPKPQLQSPEPSESEKNPKYEQIQPEHDEPLEEQQEYNVGTQRGQLVDN